jgi:hypothetical protein
VSGSGLEPRGVISFVDFPGREGKRAKGCVHLGRLQAPSIDLQKGHRDDESGSFVAVDKRVIFDQAERTTRRQFENRGLTIGEKIEWLAQRRIQEAFVTQSGRAAESGQRLLVGQEHDFPEDPGGFIHLASSRSVWR